MDFSTVIDVSEEKLKGDRDLPIHCAIVPSRLEIASKVLIYLFSQNEIENLHGDFLMRIIENSLYVTDALIELEAKNPPKGSKP